MKTGKERSVTHSTFVIERSYPATPERVFAAFSDPAKKRLWFAEGEGLEVEEFEMDFRTGGKERARFRSKAGFVFRNDTVYQDILPNCRIVMAYTMSAGDQRISASLATIEFLPADGEGPALSSLNREHSLRARMVLKYVRRDGVSYSASCQKS